MRSFGIMLVAFVGVQFTSENLRSIYADDVQTFMRAVSTGTVVVKSGDVGEELSPYFVGFQPIRPPYEDRDVFVAVGRNDQDLILYAWSKSNRSLTVDELSSRVVEEALGSVETVDDMKAFKNYRILFRGAVFDLKEGRNILTATAFVGTTLVEGLAGADSEIPRYPVVYRFSKAKPVGEVRAHLESDTRLASFFE